MAWLDAPAPPWSGWAAVFGVLGLLCAIEGAIRLGRWLTSLMHIRPVNPVPPPRPRPWVSPPPAPPPPRPTYRDDARPPACPTCGCRECVGDETRRGIVAIRGPEYPDVGGSIRIARLHGTVETWRRET